MATTEPYTLACQEIWGGNLPLSQDVVLPGLRGWIHSEPLPGSAAGGDVYYLSLCSQGELTRMGVADISGHGQEASSPAQCLRRLMHKYIDTLDQSEMARELNRSFDEECRGSTFATVVLLGVYGRSGELVLTNGGHPPPLRYRRATRQWGLLKEDATVDHTGLEDLPLGIIAGTSYHQLSLRLEPGDLVLIHSDALSEARNRAGALLTSEGLLRLASALPVDSPRAAGEALLEVVKNYREGQPALDDVTLLVLQRLPA